MKINNLEKVLEGESKYRLKQAKSAVFKEFIRDWNETSVLPLELRKKLNQECPLSITSEIFPSKTKETIKVRLTLADGFKIESVLMHHRDGRNTVCVSSQVGCPLGCKFCATGRIGLKRNLEPFEIIEQVLFFERYLKKETLLRPLLLRQLADSEDKQGYGGQGKKGITNIVFMGMGEPFLNYENVMAAIRILNEKDGLGIGARHISISTAGVVEGIKKFTKENLQINLAISLHASNNKLRSQLIPLNKKYPIEKILKAVDDYIKRNKRKVMFEYLLISGVNDSDECASELAKLMKRPLYFVNLILYNPTCFGFEPSSFERIKQFKRILERSGVKFSQRYRFGQEIKAACGQLAIEEK